MQPSFDAWFDNTQNLLKQSEAIQQQMSPHPPLESVWNWQRLLHELQIYQAEVEVQHEELRESQSALQVALDKYTELYDFAPIGYLTLDYSGTILEANQTASALLGIERQELIGRLLYHSLSMREDKDALYLLCNRTVASGHFESCDVTILQPDGTKRVAHLDSRAFHVEQPTFHVALSDVTARRQSEVDLQVAQDEEAALRVIRDELEQRVLHRTEALQHVNTRLQEEIAERKALEAQIIQAQKMQAIGTLAGGIAHEFNNVLTIILGFTTLLQKQIQGDPTAQEYAQRVKVAGERAKEFVRQILLFSRQDTIASPPVPLSDVINEAMGFLHQSLPTTIDLHVHLAPEAESVLARKTLLFQVLVNLGSNAEYAMRETGGRLDIEAVVTDVDAAFATRHPPLCPGSHLCLTVRDTGMGMAPDVMARIFEPFFTTKDVGQGTGMGLAMVHGMVSNHGGVVTVASTPGVGTTFTIYLPQLAAPVEIEPPAAPPVPAGSRRLLVVDDEVAIARATQDLLEREGYEVMVATSGMEALDQFRLDPHGFDCVITDQTMPRMTGLDLIRALRGLRADVPVILCTGFSHVIDAMQTHALGLDALMMKPIDIVELVAMIQQVLARDEKLLHSIAEEIGPTDRSGYA